MKIANLHPWDVTPAEAVRIQRNLAGRVTSGPVPTTIRYVAGADLALSREGGIGYGGVVVLSYPDLVVVETRGVALPLRFPYIPGLLGFREAPLLAAAFEQVEHEPDVIFIDGHGRAHPRAFGIACHVGLLLDRPTIGCAKSRLFGAHADPDRHAGATAPLRDPRGQTIGAVVRTRTAVSPVYISIGHRIELTAAVELALRCARFRVPEPTRRADQYVGRLKAEMSAAPASGH